MRTLRASEIASFIYCRRAWWYQRQGIQSENQGSLASGMSIHAKHGRSILVSGCLSWLAYALLLLAVILLTLHFASGFFPP